LVFLIYSKQMPKIIHFFPHHFPLFDKTEPTIYATDTFVKRMINYLITQFTSTCTATYMISSSGSLAFHITRKLLPGNKKD
jgi:hypothetical protein